MSFIGTRVAATWLAVQWRSGAGSTDGAGCRMSLPIRNFGRFACWLMPDVLFGRSSKLIPKLHFSANLLNMFFPPDLAG